MKVDICSGDLVQRNTVDLWEKTLLEEGGEGGGGGGGEYCWYTGRVNLIDRHNKHTFGEGRGGRGWGWGGCLGGIVVFKGWRWIYFIIFRHIKKIYILFPTPDPASHWITAAKLCIHTTELNPNWKRVCRMLIVRMDITEARSARRAWIWLRCRHRNCRRNLKNLCFRNVSICSFLIKFNVLTLSRVVLLVSSSCVVFGGLLLQINKYIYYTL